MEKKNSLTFCIHILGKVILMYHLVHSMLYDILPYSMTVLCCAESLSSIPLFVIPWTVAHPPAPGSSVHGHKTGTTNGQNMKKYSPSLHQRNADYN